MSKLDPRLRMLVESTHDNPGLESAAEAEAVPLGTRLGWTRSDAGPAVEVIVEGSAPDDLQRLAPGVEYLGPATTGSIRAARVPIAALPALADSRGITRIEAARPMFAELNWSRVESRAERVHTAAPPVLGRGALIAVIDSGIDYTHPCFRRADGRTRILRIWDQSAPSGDGRDVPAGRVYTAGEIDAALAATDPFDVVPHRDRDANGHGTHVAGIAAGDERGNDVFTGIAPEAELLVVALATGAGGALGSSPWLVSALDWVVDQAGGRPVAINISQGTNGGGHSGESLVERRIDELAREPGVVVVKSAGNEQQWDIHAGGALVAGEERTLTFDVRSGNLLDDIVEIWFGKDDEITVGVQAPTGPATPHATPEDVVRFVTEAGNEVRIDVDEDADGTGDRRATVILQRGGAGELQPGRWRIELRAGTVAGGQYDAWIERASRRGAGAPEQSRFVAGDSDRTRTLTVPGTARRIITVASHTTKSNDRLAIGGPSAFSSHGPTRLGMAKPDLSAPGEFVMSAQAGGGHVALSGTSMAAPHVTGAAALLLSVRPELSSEQVAQIFRRSALQDGRVAAGPADGWGGGKLDVEAALRVAEAAVFPVVTSARAAGTRFTVRTDRPTRLELRVHRNPARLALGQAEHILVSAGPTAAHEVDLTTLPPAHYSAELRVVTADGWWRVDDARGRFHDVPIDARPQDTDDLERIEAIEQEFTTTTFDPLAGDESESVTAARDRHPFTLVALTERRTGRLIGWEAADPRTGDLKLALDTDSLVAFLTDKATSDKVRSELA
jgi:subtilisin family serine protease